MSQSEKQNMSHSVFQRLLNHAKSRNEDFNLLLFRYGIERLLYRLSISSYADDFVLKGASLFLVWKGQNYRVTKDADLLSFGPADAELISGIFRELCHVAGPDIDGLIFVPETVRATSIREKQAYDGIRVTLLARLHNARISLQVDIGFGDAVTPAPERIIYPTLLEDAPPRLLAYTPYTVVAEKFEAMVSLGMLNSRMKDFFDVWLLSRLFEFDGQLLCTAIRNTFRRRSVSIPAGMPLPFKHEFRKDAQKLIQWRAFIRKSKPEYVPEDFGVVIDEISAFLMQVIDAAREERLFGLKWKPKGPWY